MLLEIMNHTAWGVLAMQTNCDVSCWTFGSGDVSNSVFPQHCHTIGRWQFNMFNDCTALRQQSDCRALRGEERRCFSHLGLVKTHILLQKLSVQIRYLHTGTFVSSVSFTAKNRHLLELLALSAADEGQVDLDNPRQF